MPSVNHNHRRRGVALLWVALLLLIFIGFIGLACDTAWVALVNGQLQNGADASALAAARLVRAGPDLARQAAVDLGLANTAGVEHNSAVACPVRLDLNSGNDPGGDIVIGRYNRTTGIFTPDVVSLPNAVKVVARRSETSQSGTLPMLFGNAFSTPYASPQRSAIAVTAGGLGAGLLVLDPVGPEALQLAGGTDLVVLHGTIQVNSSSSTAVRVGGNYSITGEELNIVGSMNNPPTTITVNTGMPVLPDPLAWLVAPSLSGMPVYGDVNNPGVVTLQPGRYPNGIRATNANNIITCEPGVYYLGTPNQPNSFPNRGLTIHSGTFTANQCTFYIAAGSVDLTANGIVTITPPPFEAGHYYEHISIFQARDNYAQASIWAGDNSNIQGTLYFPGRPNDSPPGGPQFDLNGTGFGQGVQVITYRMRLGGDANLNVYFDGWWAGPLYTRVFLVH